MQPFLKIFNWNRKRKMLAFHRKFIQKNDLVFDIGANVGKRTQIYLHLGAKVIAVEPQPDCIIALEKIKNVFQNLKIIRKGVASNNNPLKMYISNISEVSTFSKEFIDAYKFQQELRWNEGQDMEMTTLDELIAEYGKPSYCKIDTENFEPEVLSGLSIPIPTISFEFNYPFRSNSITCIRKLVSLTDYRFNMITFENPEFAFGVWLKQDEMIAEMEKLSPEVLTGEIFASARKTD